jgi:phospholipase C
MNVRALLVSIPVCCLLGCSGAPAPGGEDGSSVSASEAVEQAAAGPSGDIHAVEHVIVLMQENHSFDNYFGALAYAPGSPYHSPKRRDRDDGCRSDDHRCVDGLSCEPTASGELRCENANQDDAGPAVHAFHDARRCVIPDLDHEWPSTHREINFDQPNRTLQHPKSDGFVRVNDVREQPDNGVENPTEDQTMSFYDQREIPFYYDVAQSFAISDRYFSSLLGPTFPNRAYLLAATSFGHLTTSDNFPPPGGYKPNTGTILDLLDAAGVSWADYFQDAPQAAAFRPFGPTAIDPHFFPLPLFLAQAAGAPGVPPLPTVSFVDPNFGLLGAASESDEHPPTDIQRGQAFVSQVVNALRNGPYWSSSVMFVMYDEHGGFYDHVKPPRARQGGRTPDGVSPGQCADLSNPPASLAPGGGAECSSNFLSATDTSVVDAIALCPELAADPTGPFPRDCASFDQLGVRVPLLAISPFSKAHYVSHDVGDHTSILAFIEKAFLPAGAHLTGRDQRASTLEDLFDFAHSPSLATPVGLALPPAQDCTPVGTPAQITP